MHGNGPEAYRRAVTRATRLAESGNVLESVAALREVISLDPKRPDAYYELALLYHQQAKVTEAITCFERAADLAPEDATVWNNLGVLHFAQGAWVQAERAFRQALSLDERYADAWHGLASALLGQGRAAEAAAEALRPSLSWEPGHGKAREEQSGVETDSAPMATVWGHLRMKGYFARRSWCRENAQIIRHLLGFEELRTKMRGTRFWEYAFAFKEVMKRPRSAVLDIGVGRGAFASVLAKSGHWVVSVDNYESCWGTLRNHRKRRDIDYMDADARDLPIRDERFDFALLISTIEHVPTGTIFCEKTRAAKTAEMLRAEMPEKRRVIREALRAVKPGGTVIITSDTYLDYPPGMNISWQEMLGYEGIDMKDIRDGSDLYISDNPIHKGRVLPLGLTLEKTGSGSCRPVS